MSFILLLLIFFLFPTKRDTKCEIAYFNFQGRRIILKYDKQDTRHEVIKFDQIEIFLCGKKIIL